MVALTRMISAVLRHGGDVSFVVEELKAVFNPRGGQWIQDKYIPLLLAAIGEQSWSGILLMSAYMRDRETPVSPIRHHLENPPGCGSADLKHFEGCDVCRYCGFSKCA
tara:strand:- start:62 stop:385 length:324 start_codon:yes stop_codon:yes gene_type:complete